MQLTKNPTVSAIAAVDLADELISRDMLDQAVLNVISIDLDNVYQEHHAGRTIIEKRLSETDLLSLWKIAISSKARPSLGFDIGQSVNVNAKGLLANSLSCCDTLKQALNVFHDNIALLNEAESWSIKQESQHIKLSFMFNSKYTYPVMAIERSMVALIAWAEHFTSSKLNVQGAKFEFDRPGYSHRYNAIFGANISFNAGENSIELLDSELNKAIHSSNPYLRNLISERSENIPFQATKITTTQAKVESLLKADLMTYCHLDAQLRMLKMSKATLYRKLKGEGANFSSLVLKERMSILTKLQQVHTHYSNEQSSAALGFKDVSSFYKFLKKVSKS
tara:strand:+ start:68642 stop:69649 length:1008 start_codon:yes stop_codon:yes gene_type:complete